MVLMVWPRPLVRFRPSVVDLRIGSLAFLLCFFFSIPPIIQWNSFKWKALSKQD